MLHWCWKLRTPILTMSNVKQKVKKNNNSNHSILVWKTFKITFFKKKSNNENARSRFGASWLVWFIAWYGFSCVGFHFERTSSRRSNFLNLFFWECKLNFFKNNKVIASIHAYVESMGKAIKNNEIALNKFIITKSLSKLPQVSNFFSQFIYVDF